MGGGKRADQKVYHAVRFIGQRKSVDPWKLPPAGKASLAQPIVIRRPGHRGEVRRQARPPEAFPMWNRPMVGGRSKTAKAPAGMLDPPKLKPK